MAEYFATQSYAWSVTVYSDGSKDKTVQVAQQFCENHPHFFVVDCQPNRGKGAVVRDGMMQVLGEYLLFSDADLATPIEEVEKLLAAIQSADIAIGSRPLKESNLEIRQPIHREILGRVFNFAVQLLAIKGIKDTQCGFKLFRSDTAKEVFSRCKVDGFGFDFESLMVAVDLRKKISEVPVRWRHMEGSKVVLMRDGPRMLGDLLKLRLAGKSKRLQPRFDS